MGAACQFIKEKLVTTEQCIPYTGKEGTCPRACSNGRAFAANSTAWQGTTFRHLRSVSEIMTAIYAYGSVTAGFQVYSDFEQYRGGVYRHQSGQHKGGHAIKIIGWGTEQGVPYWLCQNTWGANWGDRGFFKFLRGENHCEMESEVWEVSFPEGAKPPTPTPPKPEPQPPTPVPPTPVPPTPVPPTPVPPTPVPPTPVPPTPVPPTPVPPVPSEIPCIHKNKEGVSLRFPSDVCPPRDFPVCITSNFCRREEEIRALLAPLASNTQAQECYRYARAYLCADAFPKTDRIGNTFLPCQNVCNWFVYRCRPYLEDSLTWPNCNALPREDIIQGVGTNCSSPL